MKIVIATDSFKGSASSSELTGCMTERLSELLPEAEVSGYVISDGGEGYLEAFSSCVSDASIVNCKACGPLMEDMTGRFLLYKDTAVVCLADTAGLTLVPHEMRNPLYTTTEGTGKVIAAALDMGIRKFVIGIGGSATNDAGTGILHALGYRFLDDKGHRLEPCGASLPMIRTIDGSHARKELKDCSFTIACDVDNPFTGERGAAKVYGPQKGAGQKDVGFLEKGMSNFADVLFRYNGTDVNNIAGAGAAGGVGGGLKAVLGASLVSGTDILLGLCPLEEDIKTASLVITGEGCIDRQSTMGKLPGRIAAIASRYGVPAVALCGKVDGSFDGSFKAVPIHDGPVSPDEASDRELTLRKAREKLESIVRNGIR